MNLDTYQHAITRTAAPLDRDELVKLSLLGLAGELGEVCEPVKKSLYRGHELDLGHLEEEIGDLCWYLGTLCNALGLSLTDCLYANLSKLARRYPRGFACVQSLHCATDEVLAARLFGFLSSGALFLDVLLETAARGLELEKEAIEEACITPTVGEKTEWIVTIGEEAVWISDLPGLGLTVTMVQYPGWLDEVYVFHGGSEERIPEDKNIVPFRSHGQKDVETDGEEVQ